MIKLIQNKTCEKQFIQTIRRLGAGCILGIFLLFSAGCSASSYVRHVYESDELDSDTMENEQETATEAPADSPTGVIVIYICGAVLHPGVYELPEGSRVIHAIEAAGGLLEEADPHEVNQAGLLADGEQIRIWTKDEVKETDAGKGDGKVNLNRATKEELMQLPGIGEAKANAILAYREEQGDFRSIEDVMKISGIKESVFSQIKDLITV